MKISFDFASVVPYIGMAYESLAIFREDPTMDWTLFSPFMLDTFKACKRAYSLARERFSDRSRPQSLASLCKQFVLRGVSEINKGKIQNNNQLQIFIGQHWPVDKLEKAGFGQDQIARSFLYVYKTLLHYVRCPYIPDGAEVVASAQRVRARVPQVRVYLEDTFDLILWYPERRHLEIVDFRLKLPQEILKCDPLPSNLARQFLASKLRSRWPYQTLSSTTCKITPKGIYVSEKDLPEDQFNNNWDNIVRDLQEMKTPSQPAAHKNGEDCFFCEVLDSQSVASTGDSDDHLSLSA